MIDLSKTLDMGTNFPATWKTLVRELLLKFEDGCTYTHHNIAGNRPYTVNLEIKIDDPVDDETYKKLHEEADERDHELEQILADMEAVLSLSDEELEAHVEKWKRKVLEEIRKEKEKVNDDGDNSN